MLKKIFSNYTVLMLIAFNLYFIGYYQQHPQGFKTLLLIYWFQSVMIGFFTFLQLLITPKENIEEAITDKNTGKPVSKGCSALFFALHYGTFHFVYLIFLVMRKDGPLDFNLLLISICIIIVTEAIEFFRKVQGIKTQKVNQSLTFFLPYLRIIPMHLMILGAAFWGMSDVTIFLLLKTLADVAMHLLTNRLYFRTVQA